MVVPDRESNESPSSSRPRRSGSLPSYKVGSLGGGKDNNNNNVVTRGKYDVAILSGATPFVLTCKETQAYKRWEGSLREAVAVHQTWTSFRRKEDVMEFFKAHVGDKVRFLIGNDGARNDKEAEWRVLSEVESMQKSKEAFQNIEKSSRHVESWHGVVKERIIRTPEDIPLVSGSSDFAKECRSTPSFALYEKAMKKAVKTYNKSWTAFRRSGGVLGYFQTELGKETRILRAKNEMATSEDGADWEELSGEPLTAFMENQFLHYACLVEDEDDEKPAATTAVVKPMPAPTSAAVPDEPKSFGQALDVDRKAGAAGKKRKTSAAQLTASQSSDGAESDPENLATQQRGRKRKSSAAKPPPAVASHPDNSSSDDEAFLRGDLSEKKTKSGGKAAVPMPASKPSATSRKEFTPADSLRDNTNSTTTTELTSRHVTCSIFLLSKAVALVLGRIDVKVKTRWTLDRLRQEIDPILRQKQYLTMNAPWEFYFYESGSFVSQTYENRMNIGEYLMEANQENSMSIRVV